FLVRLGVAGGAVGVAVPGPRGPGESGEESLHGDLYAEAARKAQGQLPHGHRHVEVGAGGPGAAEVEHGASHTALERDAVTPAVAETGDRDLGGTRLERRQRAARAVGAGKADRGAA